MIKNFQKLIWFLTVNDVETDGSPPYAGLKPVVTTASPDQIFEELFEFFNNRHLWTITDTDRTNFLLSGEVKTPFFGFIDDISIQLRKRPESNPEPNPEQWIIHLRSRARLGEGDFGKNARNIRCLTNYLTKRLPQP